MPPPKGTKAFLPQAQICRGQQPGTSELPLRWDHRASRNGGDLLSILTKMTVGFTFLTFRESQDVLGLTVSARASCRRGDAPSRQSSQGAAACAEPCGLCAFPELNKQGNRGLSPAVSPLSHCLAGLLSKLAFGQSMAKNLHCAAI